MIIKNYLFIEISNAIVVALILLGFTIKANTQITPSLLFSNGMVLQRNVEIPVWGKAKGATDVTVKLNNTTKNATVADGKWEVMLPPFEAGGPYTMTIESARTKKKLRMLFSILFLQTGIGFRIH